MKDKVCQQFQVTGWKPEGEFHQPYYAKLYKTVMTEYQTRKIFPPADDLFNAFHFTPLNEVKVVILGQDPYHNDGQAHGLCFSVKRSGDAAVPGEYLSGTS